jgi:hypothetical protein
VAMSGTNPSFYRLFRRSAYYKSAEDDSDSEEAEHARKERERFAAAALAFCLKHDRKFLRYFWTNVCRVQADPSRMPPIKKSGILIEPPRWADIRLVADGPPKRYVWVVEVKAGAPLEAIQDPRSDVFSRRDQGYGWFLRNEEESQKTKLRYIVFGREEGLRLPSYDSSLRIAIQQRRWSDIADLSVSRLTEDLSQSLAILKIEPFAEKFMIKKAANIKVRKGLNGLGKAKTVFEALYEYLKIRSRREYEFYAEEPASVVGIYVKSSQNSSKPHSRLQKATRRGSPEAWIGYRSSDNDNITRSIWLYFDDVKKRQSALRLLKKRFPSAKADSDPPTPCVVVENMTSGEDPDDFEWFTSVFKALGVTSSARKKNGTDEEKE